MSVDDNNDDDDGDDDTSHHFTNKYYLIDGNVITVFLSKKKKEKNSSCINCKCKDFTNATFMSDHTPSFIATLYRTLLTKHYLKK